MNLSVYAELLPAGTRQQMEEAALASIAQSAPFLSPATYRDVEASTKSILGNSGADLSSLVAYQCLRKGEPSDAELAFLLFEQKEMWRNEEVCASGVRGFCLLSLLIRYIQARIFL